MILHEISDGDGGVWAEIPDGLTEKRPSHVPGRKIDGISLPPKQNQEEEESQKRWEKTEYEQWMKHGEKFCFLSSLYC